jgi:hypothetical protein
MIKTMKKVKKLMISVIGILVFVCSVGAFSSYALICENVSTDSTPIGAFETAFTALKEADGRIFNKYAIYSGTNSWFGSDLDGEGKEYILAVMEQMSYVVGDSRTEGDDVIINVTISNKNLKNVFRDMMKYLDAENPLVAAVQNTPNNQVSSNVEVKMKNDKGTWKVLIDKKLSEAVSGGAWR